MSLRDLHGPFYLSTGSDLCRDVKPGEEVTVPLWASFPDRPRAQPRNCACAPGSPAGTPWADAQWFSQSVRAIEFQPWLSKELEPLRVTMPDHRALAVLSSDPRRPGRRGAAAQLHDLPRRRWPRAARTNRSTWTARGSGVLRFAPASFSAAQWSLKQWNVLDGLKVNGAGPGYFEFRLPWPAGLDAEAVAGASLVFEASAKQLFGKDREGAPGRKAISCCGKGTHDPSPNPNSYPMTDTAPLPQRRPRPRRRAVSSANSICPTTPPTIAASSPGTPKSATSKLHEAGLLRLSHQRRRPRRVAARRRRRQGIRHPPRGGPLAARRPGPLRRTVWPLPARPNTGPDVKAAVKLNAKGMPMLVVHVHVHVKPESVEAFKRATLENARRSVQEPGIARFDVVQQQDDPTRFVLVEAYRNPQAPAAHKETQHYQTWRDAVAPMMAEPRASVKYENLWPGPMKDDQNWMSDLQQHCTLILLHNSP